MEKLKTFFKWRAFFVGMAILISAPTWFVLNVLLPLEVLFRHIVWPTYFVIEFIIGGLRQFMGFATPWMIAVLQQLRQGMRLDRAIEVADNEVQRKPPAFLRRWMIHNRTIRRMFNELLDRREATR